MSENTNDLIERLKRACDPLDPFWRHDRDAAGMAAVVLLERQAKLLAEAREALSALLAACHAKIGDGQSMRDGVDLARTTLKALEDPNQ